MVRTPDGWRWTKWGSVAMAGALAGCTAGMSSELAEPIRPPERLDVERIAILPVTAEPGSEDAVPVVTDAVAEWVGDRAADLEVVAPTLARERVGRSGLAPDLARVFADYDRSGVADPEALDRVSNALESASFLQLRVDYGEAEVTRDDPLDDDDVADEQRRDVRMLARIWRAGATAPAWEGTARAASETGLFSGSLPDRHAMLRDVTRQLLDRAPLY